LEGFGLVATGVQRDAVVRQLERLHCDVLPLRAWE
jgi:hypothetical protein